MTSKRWKLVCGALAALTILSWWHREGGAPAVAHGAPSRAELRPVWINAKPTQFSNDELVKRLLATRNVAELRILAGKLAVVGDDVAIDRLMPLVSDHRPGVPEAILGAFAAIGTDHAADVLLGFATDRHSAVRALAVEALGTTHQERIESVLVGIARDPADPAQGSAVTALGELATDHAVETLYELALSGTELGTSALSVLSTITSPSATMALRKLIDAPTTRIATAAIESITTVDDELLARLSRIVKDGETDLVPAALKALALAGEPGVPLLRETALHGHTTYRPAAIEALAGIASPQALATLREILDHGDADSADNAASAMVTINTDEARTLLINAALSDRAGPTHAVKHLIELDGADVDQALLEIAKGHSIERDDVLKRLLTAGNEEALRLVTRDATSGPESARFAAIGALGEARTPAATEALLAVVRGSTRDVALAALRTLASTRPEDPKVGALLRDSLHSGDASSATIAASALQKLGTDEARDALIGALGSGDEVVAAIAARSLEGFRMTGATSAALAAAASAHPELASQMMGQLLAAGSPAGIRLAESALASGDAGSSINAIDALATSATPEAFDLLARSTRASDADVRARALAVLGTSGDDRAAALLTQGLHDGEPTVRQAAATTLGALGTPQARDALIDLTRSANVEDRAVAISSLRGFDDPNATRRLGELIRDPDPSIATAAIEAVGGSEDASAALAALAADPNAAPSVRQSAAASLRARGELDPGTEAAVDQLFGDGAIAEPSEDGLYRD